MEMKCVENEPTGIQEASTPVMADILETLTSEELLWLRRWFFYTPANHRYIGFPFAAIGIISVAKILKKVKGTEWQVPQNQRLKKSIVEKLKGNFDETC